MEEKPSKRSHADLIVAGCALVVSAISAIGVVYQGRILSDQLSATVWPYLSFIESSNDTFLQFSIQNVGAGPALIKSATLYVDGKPQSSLHTALGLLGYASKGHDTLEYTSFGPGDVVRAGDSVRVLRVGSKGLIPLGIAMQKRARAEVCYCSMLGQCWLAKTDVDARSDVKSCDAAPKEGLTP